MRYVMDDDLNKGILQAIAKERFIKKYIYKRLFD